MKLRLFAIGLTSLLAQVVLLRELGVALFGSELIYILALGVWLAGSALGAAIGKRDGAPGKTSVRWLLLSQAVLIGPALGLSRGLRIILVGVPGAVPGLGRQLLGLALVLLPLSLLAGLLFQWAAKNAIASGSTLARTYSLECAGALSGGIIATLGLAAGLQNLPTGLICGLLSAGTAIYPEPRRLPRTLWWTGILVVAMLAGLLIASPWVDLRTTAWNHPDLLSSRDTPYGRVTLTGSEGRLAVFEDDALSYETETTAAEELVHLTALQRPSTGRILLLGGGFQGLAAESLAHAPKRIDYVELNEALLDLIVPHLPPDLRESLDSAQVNIQIDEPRRYLLADRSWDLILLGMPEPSSGRTNRFYTREFFALCARRLSPGGVLGFQLPAAANLWTPQLARRTASIRNALLAVFADVVALPASSTILLASDRPLTRDPAVLISRLRERGLLARLVIPRYLDYLYTNDRFAELEETLDAAAAPVNRDAHPVCFQSTMLVWLSRFYLPAALIELPRIEPAAVLRSPFAWLGTVCWLATLLALRRKTHLRAILLAFGAGLIGIVIEVLLLLHYQTAHGVLFQDLGLLITLFMAGLALGAALFARWFDRRPRDSGQVRRAGRLAAGGILALCLVLAATLQAGVGTALATVSLLLLAAGSLTAALFAFASLHRQPDQSRVVSPLYAADLLGGCLGSLAASLVLMPLLGLPGAALVAAFAAASVLILI